MDYLDRNCGILRNMEEGGGVMGALEGDSNAQRDETLLESKPSIFLSHSGAQKSFVDQLCVDIERHDRYPFFDKRRDSLSIGCNFPDLIFEAIHDCQVAVVVLSGDFFSRSKWPMLELAALVKKKSCDSKLIIMPVFLGLTHAQCREKLNHDRWMEVWQGWAKEDSRIDLGEWEAVLKVLGCTNGISLDERLDDVKCRREIVEAICKEVPPRTRWDDSHVQGRSHLVSAIRAKIDGTEVSKSYGARTLGLYGVGGVGKTTMCKVLCNEYFEEFGGSVCHIEFGVGSKLQRLQELLGRLTATNGELIKSFSEDECKDRLKKGMKKKVFLAIDNVSPSQQIVDEARGLLRMGFMQECIVVVTARSLAQLCNLNLEECMEMPELDEDDARSLFLYHAAPGSYLRMVGELNEEVVKQCTKRCWFGKGDGMNHHYHPLALKVLGGQLGNDPEEWIEKLNELDPFNQYGEVEKEHPVFSILGRSFEILKQEDQFLFMDAAIFYPKLREYSSPLYGNSVDIFEWLSIVHGKSPDVIKRRLEGLKGKSLLENLGDGSEEIGMHDLWREFAVLNSKGKEFDSRPWIYEKIYGLHDRRREDSKLSRGAGGSESLQRICMVGDAKEGCIVTEIDLSCYSNLRVFKLVDVYTDTELLDVSSLRQLKSLEILYSTKSPNLDILGLRCLRKLVFLHVDQVQVRTASLREEIEGLTCLQVLHIRKVYSSAILPDFSRLNMLRDVIFHSCEKEGVISGLSSNMTNLKRLDLSHCTWLRSCHGVGDLVGLEELDLFVCERLEELPNLGRLKYLRSLNISWCSLIEVVPGLGDLVSLQVLAASVCTNLAGLPDMSKLVNLQKLFVSECDGAIKAMPGLSELVALEALVANSEALKGYHDLRKLTKLERVVVRHCSGEGPSCLSDLVSLKILQIECADELTGLPNLTTTQELEISFCFDIKDLPCLSNLTALKRLYVCACDELERLPDMQSLSRLERLEVYDCESLREWESNESGMGLLGVDPHIAGTIHPQLQRLSLTKVAFTELPDLSSFPELWELQLKDCKELTRLSSSAPLTALKRLDLIGCGSLRALPDVSHLVSLSSFKVERCGELKLTAYEIVKLEAMCPGLRLDKSHLPDTDLENDDERDGKRLKSG